MGIRHQIKRTVRGAAAYGVGTAFRARLKWRDLGMMRQAQKRPDLIRTIKAPVGDHFMIAFACANGEPCASVGKFMDAAQAVGANVVLVVNGAVSDDYVARHPGLCTVIERANFGRDFGGYQAGIAHLDAQKITPKKLIFVNDSIFLDHRKGSELIQRFLDPDHAYIGLTESHEPRYHVGSFLFSIDDRVWQSPVWRAFWRDYVPWSSRRHCIDKGEVALGHSLKRAGFVPHILYNAAMTLAAMREWSLKDVQEHYDLLPEEFQHEVERAEALQPPAHSGLHVHIPADLPDDRLQHVLNNQLSDQEHQHRRLAYQAFFGELVSRIERRSQIHWAGALLAKDQGLPVMKKDLAYRGLYGYAAARQMMALLDYPDMPEVDIELRKRGIPSSLNRAQRLLFSLGLV